MPELTPSLHERARLAELRSYAILDTPREQFFDQLTQIAAQTCDTPIALISLLDADRQWFKSHFGLEVSETPRSMAFCEHAIQGSEALIVADASLDERFLANPLVCGDPGIRFYAGVPLRSANGYALGTLCVIDRRPRKLTDMQLNTLKLLAVQVSQQLELRRTAEALRRQSWLLDQTQRAAHIGGWDLNLQTQALTWTDETYRIHGFTPGEFLPNLESAISFYTPGSIPVITAAVEAAIEDGLPFDIELQIIAKDGDVRCVRAIGQRETVGEVAQRIFGVFQDITLQRQLEHELLLVAQREQAQIGFDLHEGVGQLLTGVSLTLASIAKTLPQPRGALATDIADLESQVREAIGNCRSLAQGLSSVSEQRGGLQFALRSFCARMASSHRIAIELQHDGPEAPVAERVAEHLYRIAQEAVRNAVTHGRAAKIIVRLAVNTERTVLSIVDDGVGLTGAANNSGMGLRLMRHRARLIFGSVAIEAASGGGTQVRCSLAHTAPERSELADEDWGSLTGTNG